MKHILTPICIVFFFASMAFGEPERDMGEIDYGLAAILDGKPDSPGKDYLVEGKVVKLKLKNKEQAIKMNPSIRVTMSADQFAKLSMAALKRGLLRAPARETL